ncbi:suppressor of tub2 mutation [Aspergillus tubingensis]|uniref:Suppressor of tub2 mutation n=2 Tax=Aspergillus tubingensis TaxID=5068 RepID=A0A9W6EHZ0_ASPTU|nr:suppressor of tub2 mutation [Aspergillus tubingensis]GLA72325.1 suppressor of tub2 mutation [Aspergillus tubingensis]GLA79800.1 suppressor of tub2 mutation [Aspergillus tubingensis]GLA95405.1 suppressor of tub2 mutation [Aspergillus tubingensis]GLB16673.1 suppressor of tub2 mutation [Aspergillus tubingensis]
MDSKATELVATLKNLNLAIDAKVSFLNSVKSDIKQKNVPESAIPSIFDALRLSLASSHQTLLSAGFSTMGHFLKRLFIQEQHGIVASQARHLYPVLLERLGDHKERVRAQAAQAFTDFWPAASHEVEQHVLGTALVGKNNRAREMSMIWLANMAKQYGLLFRPYVPSLVACLEDADSAVRDTAKATIVELFQNAPAHAKADLKKQLSELNVRKSIVSIILTNLGLESDEPDHLSRPASRIDQRPVSRVDQRPASRVDQRPASRVDQRPASRVDQRPTLRIEQGPSSRDEQKPASRIDQGPISRVEQKTASRIEQKPVSRVEQKTASRIEQRPASRVDQRPASRVDQRPTLRIDQRPASRVDTVTQDSLIRPASQSGTRPVEPTPSDVEPIIVSSAREIDEFVRLMTPYFEGRESEDNWVHREKSVITLRRLTHGNAPHAYSQTFVAAIKSILDGIFKVVNSLRTTMGTNGCLLIQDLARKCGPRIDPMMEIILQNLIKLCAGMKKITADNGNLTVDTVIGNVSYTHRILQHVYAASQDKNVQLRLFSAGWYITLINKQAGHKSSIEHGGGTELIERSLKKGLGDANPGVREAMRKTFWTYHSVWPQKAKFIMSDLDSKSRSLLEKDPANPAAGNKQTADRHASKSSATSQKAPTSSTNVIPGRSALKQAIAAQKKAHLAPKTAMTPRPESAPQVSSLSSAPMRPMGKSRRLEPTRPATPDQKEPVEKTTNQVVIYEDTKEKNDEVADEAEERSVSITSTVVHHPIVVADPLRLREIPLPKPSSPIAKGNENSVPKETKPPTTPSVPRDAPKNNALEELSKNEPDHRDNRSPQTSMPRLPSLHVPRTRPSTGPSNDTATHRCPKFEAAQKRFEERRRSISPRSKDPMKARQTLEKGIPRIHSKSMDIHGYHKLQGLIEFHDRLFDDEEQYSELLDALLGELERAPDEKQQYFGRPLDPKAQVLITVRYTFRHMKRLVDNGGSTMSLGEYASRIIKSIIRARKNYDTTCYMAIVLNETAEEMVSAAEFGDIVKAVVDVVSAEEASLNDRAILMVFNILTDILRQMTSRAARFPMDVLERLGDLASKFLTSEQANIRQKVTQLCVHLHTMTADDEKFWKIIGQVSENTRNLLLYFIAMEQL